MRYALVASLIPERVPDLLGRPRLGGCGIVCVRNPSTAVHSFASRSSVFSNTLAPFSICSQAVNSAGEWLRP